MLAPGGRLLANNAGEPSTALAEALVALARAGVGVTIVTGRNRTQGIEIMRLLNLSDFLGEMGTLIVHGLGPLGQTYYSLGDWSSVTLAPGLAPGELPVGKTPYQVLAQNGVVERLLQAFAGKLEPHVPYGDAREVTRSLRGYVDKSSIEAFFAHEELPLQLLDNGLIHPREHSLVDVEQIHSYHLMPRGASKALAVAADITRRGLRREQTIAIGDAIGDVQMGEETGSLVVVRNALKADTVAFALEARVQAARPTYCTEGFTADGWVEFAHALLKAKE
jgi:hydroxymethylpyrimidine pyrophosphatase-like HAD family hydrolase